MCKETLRNTVTAQSRQQYTNNSFNMWKRKLKNIIYPDGFSRAWILDCQYIWPAAPRSLEMEWANSYELEILAWNPSCFSYQSLNEWVSLFSPLVKKKKKKRKWNEMKWNAGSVRVADWLSSTKLSVQFPTCPPTSSLSLMLLLFTLNAKHPEQESLPRAQLQLLTNTHQWHLSTLDILGQKRLPTSAPLIH